ncbi:uncharacterized protein ColSpa_06009 [Colletotrichum spaethianum]|uniref:Infection structure specific protein n=1 Tax=Colletotrichum spaethianum TaxID=700344 RepID=A0AA37LG22_9PEZI|nr:uncharacterized protein ColSpa_06009 [Colletotrichum spaethianum]GKT45828.1 hypothetical protein ColSpa_06009 [Colletotrichum spaethianum]
MKAKMQSKLLVAAAVTGALAIQDISGSFLQNFRRGFEALDARDEAACIGVAAVAATITSDFPQLPSELATASNVNIPQVTDPCNFPSVTGSVGQVITSYSSALQSWQDAHITEIRSLWAACSDVPAFSAVLAEYGTAICSTALAPLTSQDAASGTAAATATATGTSTGEATGATASGEAASTTASPAAAAPRETGLLVAAAAAAAGFVGAVML